MNSPAIPRASAMLVAAMLAIDDSRRGGCPEIREVERAVDANPECAHRLMERRGWVFCNPGIHSAGGAQELLVRVSRGISDGPHGATWYGHVFRFVQGDGMPCWISILVRTWLNIDADSDEAVLQKYTDLVVLGNKHEPGYRQGPDDITSKHASFSEAVLALADKIRNFKREMRDPRIAYWMETSDGDSVPIDGEVPDSDLCLRCFDVYGFTDSLCQKLSKGAVRS